MNHRIAGAALGALAALALAAPAQAQDVDTYFFHCTGPSKVQNGATLASLVPAAGVTQALWNKTAPSASFQTGAGCGFADTPGPDRRSTVAHNAYDASYSGPHDKAVESVKLELHNLVTSRVRQGTTSSFLVTLFDGRDTTAVKILEQPFTNVTGTLSSSGATEKFVVELKGLKIPKGTGRFLTVGVHTLDATPQSWVHDATEVPASVTFTSPPPPPAA